MTETTPEGDVKFPPVVGAGADGATISPTTPEAAVVADLPDGIDLVHESGLELKSFGPGEGPPAHDVQGRLEGRGRLLLRYSGTEPLARIMIEGQSQEEIERLAEELAAVIRRTLGAG